MKTVCNIKTIAVWLIMTFTSCSDYLDIMPDNVATMEHAFSTRNVTKKFLYSCYSLLPNPADFASNPGLVSGDESWWCLDVYEGGARIHSLPTAYLAQGLQNADGPNVNYWDGLRSGINLFIAIRDCNIFLENIHLPSDIVDIERAQWTAEVKFLKAYYHYYLLRNYGPVPIIRENIPVNASAEQIQIYREPVEDVVNYIVELIDEAMPDLIPSTFATQAEDAGRITQSIAASVKAEALVWLASPLLNGSEEEPPTFSLIDMRGVQLFPQEYKPEKWARAAQAAKDAIDICKQNGHELYTYQSVGLNIQSDFTKLKCTLRGAITDKFNSEIIWPDTRSTNYLEINVMPLFVSTAATQHGQEFGPTLKIAEEYYTRNGLPIDEDEEWINWVGDNFSQRYAPIVVSTVNGSGINGESSLRDDHLYRLQGNETTAKLHFYREPRFYAWIGCDRNIWEMNGMGESGLFLKMKAGEMNGVLSTGRHNTCGYVPKKLVNMTSLQISSGGFTLPGYTFPLIRLTGLYLLYAEALNESQGPGPEVYQWIDAVRTRAGVPTVLDAYTKAIASKRNKPATKAGMREIIKRERLIELSFESQRFYDLIRWMDAQKYWSEPVRGWNNVGRTIESFYNVTTYFNQREFNTRDYFWPIRLGSLQTYSKLVQNPGW
jgi:hypothetical protein